MRPILVIVLSCFLSVQLNAQNQNSGYTFNMDIGLPISVGNESFQDIMQGLACTNVYGQYTFPFQLNLGVGVRYSLFTIDEFAISEDNIGQIHLGAAFTNVGYSLFHTDRFATDFGVKVGYSWNYADTDLNNALGLNPVVFESVLVEPTLGLVLFTDKQNSYRWNIGYCIQGYGFRPGTIGLSSNSAYDSAKFDNLTNYFVVGFGYTHYFGNTSN
ncbi:MAG: hypothetical protein P8N52_09615 [Crocinitomicaceae bacterium]|nr:hypothetical protein [Crocinitomicaceae bacterium]MDG1777368.1 hypothetical protein [Crocinitomicaceae bacterium]